MFDQVANVTSIDKKWHISLVFNLTTLSQKLVALQTEITEINKVLDEAISKNVSSDIYSSYKQEIADEMNILEQRMTTFYNLTPKIRGKRAVEFIGDVWKALFGNLNAEDGRGMRENIAELHIQNEQIRALSGSQVLVVTKMETAIENTTKVVLALANEVNKIQYDMSQTINENLGTIQKQLKILFFSHDLETKLATFTFYLNQFHNQIDNLIKSIHESLHENLSPFIVSPKTLTVLLTKISETLEPHQSMIWPIIQENLSKYYKIAMVSASRNDAELNFTIQIPTTTKSNKFKLFKIFTYPVYWEKIQHYVCWETEPYFLVNENYKLHTSLSKDQADKCLRSFDHICELNTAFYYENNPTCELELFSSNKTDICSRKIVSDKKPQVIKAENGWIIIRKGTYTLAANCQNHHNQIWEVKENVLITNATNCEIKSSSFVMPSITHNYLMHHEQIMNIRVPNIHTIIQPDEEIKMLNLTENPEILKKIKETLKQQKEIPIEKLKETVIEMQNAQGVTFEDYFKGGISVTTLVMVVAIIYVITEILRQRNPPTVRMVN